MELGTFALVSTYSAGVHCGTLAAQDGRRVTLTDARRVWRWRGANTLHELALHGADDTWTHISEPVATIDLSEAIEVIACTPEARANLQRSRCGFHAYCAAIGLDPAFVLEQIERMEASAK